MHGIILPQLSGPLTIGSQPTFSSLITPSPGQTDLFFIHSLGTPAAFKTLSLPGSSEVQAANGDKEAQELRAGDIDWEYLYKRKS